MPPPYCSVLLTCLSDHTRSGTTEEPNCHSIPWRSGRPNPFISSKCWINRQQELCFQSWMLHRAAKLSPFRCTAKVQHNSTGAAARLIPSGSCSRQHTQTPSARTAPIFLYDPTWPQQSFPTQNKWLTWRVKGPPQLWVSHCRARYEYFLFKTCTQPTLQKTEKWPQADTFRANAGLAQLTLSQLPLEKPRDAGKAPKVQQAEVEAG